MAKKLTENGNLGDSWAVYLLALCKKKFVRLLVCGGDPFANGLN
jgi:hypothetical protein